MRTDATLRAEVAVDRMLILGAGGHGKVVLDAILAGETIGGGPVFVDDRELLWRREVLGVPVLGSLGTVLRPSDRVHVAIGDNRARMRLLASLANEQRLTVLHPRAVVSDHAVVGLGSFVAAAAVVAPDAVLGSGVIVNHGAVVDHDCVIGDGCHVAPLASLGGGVRLGTAVMVGAGARVLPGLRIGDGAVIGAGAVVLGDVAAGVLVVGVPARQRDERVIG